MVPSSENSLHLYQNEKTIEERSKRHITQPHIKNKYQILKIFRSWQDSNLQSPDPKSGALSIRPHDLSGDESWPCERLATSQVHGDAELQAGLKHRSSVRQCVSTGQGRALYGPVGHNIIFSLVCSKISPRNVNVIYLVLVCIFYYLTGGGGDWAVA